MSDATSYLRDLITSAETPDTLRAAEQLLLSLEAEQSRQAKWTCRTLQEVAEFFGVSLSSVKQWRIENPPMPGDESGYNLREIVQWRLLRQASSPLKDEQDRQRIAMGELRMEQQRIELEKLKGSLLSRQDVEEWATQAIIQFREAMMQIPQAVAQFAPVEYRTGIEQNASELVKATLTLTYQRMEAMAGVATTSSAKPARARKKTGTKPKTVRGRRNRPA